MFMCKLEKLNNFLPGLRRNLTSVPSHDMSGHFLWEASPNHILKADWIICELNSAG